MCTNIALLKVEHNSFPHEVTSVHGFFSVIETNFGKEGTVVVLYKNQCYILE